MTDHTSTPTSSEDPASDPRKLTFSQAQRLEPLPVLATERLPQDVRIALWEAFAAETDRAAARNPSLGTFAPIILAGAWEEIVLLLAQKHLHMPSDDLALEDSLYGRSGTAVARVRNAFRPFFIDEAPWNRVLDLVQDAMRHRRCPTQFIYAVKNVLEERNTSYFVDTNGPPTIFSATTEQEREAITSALQGLKDAGRIRATDRLRRAGERFREGYWGDSAHHSISAVESLLKGFDTGENRLTKILGEMQRDRDWDIHPAFTDAVDKLFGWASNVADARHGGEDEARAVSREEAEFMIPVCSAICTYLLAKERAESPPENPGEGNGDG